MQKKDCLLCLIKIFPCCRRKYLLLIYFKIQVNSLAFFLNSNFWIFPVEVFGNSQNAIFFGILKPANVSLQKSISSFSVVSLSFAFSIKAQGTSPHFSSGLATTAAIETLGCLAKVFSISIEDMFSPPEIIISFDLSLIFM